jgi:hypothetical protein
LLLASGTRRRPLRNTQRVCPAVGRSEIGKCRMSERTIIVLDRWGPPSSLLSPASAAIAKSFIIKVPPPSASPSLSPSTCAIHHALCLLLCPSERTVLDFIPASTTVSGNFHLSRALSLLSVLSLLLLLLLLLSCFSRLQSFGFYLSSCVHCETSRCFLYCFRICDEFRGWRLLANLLSLSVSFGQRQRRACPCILRLACSFWSQKEFLTSVCARARFCALYSC